MDITEVITAVIDFHTHILPGVDDGSRSVQESLEMLKKESGQRIKTVVLTPHYSPEQESPSQFVKRRDASLRELKENLPRSTPKLYAGAEVEYFDGIALMQDLDLLTVENTNLLLLEMPYCAWTARMIQDILDIGKFHSVTVVLAHIDRYLNKQSSAVLTRLLENGILFQANASFFLKWTSRRKAMKMLKKGSIHFIGSDCHGANWREPNMGQIADRIAPYTRAFKDPFDS